MYLRLVFSFVLTSPKFLHKALSRAYAERECMSLRFAHTVSWFSDKASSIILEPPPSFRASGGVCRLRACQLRPAPPFTKLLKLFSQEALRTGCLLRCTEVYNANTKTRPERFTPAAVPYQQEKDIRYPNSLRYLR